MPADQTIEYIISKDSITLDLSSDFLVSPADCVTTLEFRNDASVPITPNPFSFDTSSKIF